LVVSNAHAIPAPVIVPDRMFISYESFFSVAGYGFQLSYFSAQGIYSKPGNTNIDLACSR
jgi:hypothetical protein